MVPVLGNLAPPRTAIVPSPVAGRSQEHLSDRSGDSWREEPLPTSYRAWLNRAARYERVVGYPSVTFLRTVADGSCTDTLSSRS